VGAVLGTLPKTVFAGGLLSIALFEESSQSSIHFVKRAFES
jgi:hypothetical protein